MNYTFTHIETGAEKDFDFPMGECPVESGHIYKEVWRRIFSAPNVGVVRGIRRGRDHHFVSRSLPRDPHGIRGTYNRVNKLGQPMFSTLKEINEVCAKSKDTDPKGGGYNYDPEPFAEDK